MGLLALFTLGLKIVPYKTLARWMPRSGRSAAEPWRKRRLLRDMRRAARLVPGGTCLPQALTGYLLFALQGMDGRIRIGVTRDENRSFRAHATLMSGEDVVIGGGPEYEGFVTLTELRPGQRCAD